MAFVGRLTPTNGLMLDTGRVLCRLTNASNTPSSVAGHVLLAPFMWGVSHKNRQGEKV